MEVPLGLELRKNQVLWSGEAVDASPKDPPIYMDFGKKYIGKYMKNRKIGFSRMKITIKPPNYFW